MSALRRRVVLRSHHTETAAPRHARTNVDRVVAAMVVGWPPAAYRSGKWVFLLVEQFDGDAQLFQTETLHPLLSCPTVVMPARSSVTQNSSLPLRSTSAGIPIAAVYAPRPGRTRQGTCHLRHDGTDSR